MAREKYKVSFVIPTYNAGKYLTRCLKSIFKQTYKNFEVLIIDGGSSDRTLAIAKKFKTKVFNNPFRDAESGKSIGIQKSKGGVVALVDADNEIVQKDWLEKMIVPLVKHSDVWGVESPWLLNKKDGLINKYFTLLQVADPVARRFHPRKPKSEDVGDYVLYKEKYRVPVIGANGFLWRKSYVEEIGEHAPKFEEVNYVSKMLARGYYKYARHKEVGIYHYYSESVGNYVQKRLKIGRKFLGRKLNHEPTWTETIETREFINSLAFNALIIGPLIEGVRNFSKTREPAWLLHPFFSFLTIAVYLYTVLESIPKAMFKKLDIRKGEEKEVLSEKLYTKDYYLYNCEGAKDFRVKDRGLTLRMKKALDLADLKEKDVVLDVGSGRGEVVVSAAQNCKKSIGLDYSKNAISIANKSLLKLPVKQRNKIKFIQGDIIKLPLKDNSFSHVLLLDVIEHLYDWQIEIALDEIKRVLTKGGKFIVHTNPNSWFLILYTPIVLTINKVFSKNIMVRGKYSTKLHVNEHSPLELKRKLEKAGFKRVNLEMDFIRLKERGGVFEATERLVKQTPLRYFLLNDIWAEAIK